MRRLQIILVVIVPLLLLILVGVALASSSASYTLGWHVLSAGGAPAQSASGNVSINGSLGQTAIGSSTAGNTTVWAGFWHSFQQALTDFFLPLIQRSH